MPWKWWRLFPSFTFSIESNTAHGEIMESLSRRSGVSLISVDP